MTLAPAILGFLEEPLKDLLIFLHGLGLTWAWAIVAVTAIVRLLILPLGIKQTRSSLAMQRLQPYVKQLQQKYRDDRQALNVAIMEFYRDNRVNPLASCLPLLLQLPIFLALFFVLRDFDAPAGTSTDYSFLWGFIDDIRIDVIDVGWQGWVLILFYVASQMLASYTMITNPDPRQKIIFMILPVLFVPIIVNFPVGLLLYWTTTNLWSMGQYLAIVQLSSDNHEVVMPADSKGAKKVIAPNAPQKRQEQGKAKAKPQPRRNRRRK